MAFKLYYDIRERLEKIGKGTGDLCDRAGIDRYVLYTWGKKKPKTFEIAEKFEEALKAMEAEHSKNTINK